MFIIWYISQQDSLTLKNPWRYRPRPPHLTCPKGDSHKTSESGGLSSEPHVPPSRHDLERVIPPLPLPGQDDSTPRTGYFSCETLLFNSHLRHAHWVFHDKAFLSDYLINLKLHRTKKNFIKNCPQWGLNSQPTDHDSNALTTEISQHSVVSLNLHALLILEMNKVQHHRSDSEISLAEWALFKKSFGMAIGHDSTIKQLNNVLYLVVNVSYLSYLTKNWTINIFSLKTLNTSENWNPVVRTNWQMNKWKIKYNIFKI